MVLGSASSQASGQGSAQLADLLLAFGLSSLIGAEREFRQRSAGLRTYTLVGFGAALFMLISKYGSATSSSRARSCSTRAGSRPRS
jgi:putative Mg2+ transporter-C (MgtC) family protein